MKPHYRIETVTRNRYGYMVETKTEVIALPPKQYVREKNANEWRQQGGQFLRTILLSSTTMTEEEAHMHTIEERNRIIAEAAARGGSLKW